MTHNLEPRTINRFPHENLETSSRALFDVESGSRLQHAIDGLYSAFAPARLSLPLSYCPHCFTESDAQYIAGTPLRELTIGDITFILPKATTTLGSDADFNYFLPRVFEALAYQAHYTPEVLPDRVRKARAADWSQAQLDGVVAFIAAYIAAVNEMQYNTAIIHDLENYFAELKRALPELRDELEPCLNDPDAIME